MAISIEDYFPHGGAPHIRVLGIDAPPLSAAVPDVADLDAALTPVADLLAGKRIAALTGAGLSTDSGLADYRSPGRPPRHPITLQQFMADPDWRQRYWARNHIGWRGPEHAEPNAGHKALAFLESLGVVVGVITQNIDRLHERAGSRRVVDLHGRYDQVICTQCGKRIARTWLAREFDRLNPHWEIPGVHGMEFTPDADAEVENTGGFVVAPCPYCGGVLRPDVVFFGGSVHPEDYARGAEIIDDAQAVLVAGSSLAVGSAMRFVRQAHKDGKPIVVINRGATKADKWAEYHVTAGTSEALAWLADEL